MQKFVNIQFKTTKLIESAKQFTIAIYILKIKFFFKYLKS